MHGSDPHRVLTFDPNSTLLRARTLTSLGIKVRRDAAKIRTFSRAKKTPKHSGKSNLHGSRDH